MLRPGILTVYGAGGEQKIVVLGGFAEVSAQGPDRAGRRRRGGRGFRSRRAASAIAEMERSIEKMEPGSALDS